MNFKSEISNFAERRSSGPPALRYIEGRAAGPTIVLLHGVTRCAEDWQLLWRTLANPYKIIAVDQRGHGGAERADRYLVMDYVADAVDLIRNTLSAPVILCGHSLGAMVAAAVAGEVPERVRALILEDPPFHTMGRNIHGAAWEMQFTGMRAAAQRGGSIDQLTDALADIRVRQNDGELKRLGDIRDRASLQWSAQCLAALDPEVLTPIIEGKWLDGYDIAGTFQRVRRPTLLLQADPRAGGAMTDADAALCEASIASCRVERFTGHGHLLHWVATTKMAEVVDEFVVSLSR